MLLAFTCLLLPNRTVTEIVKDRKEKADSCPVVLSLATLKPPKYHIFYYTKFEELLSCCWIYAFHTAKKISSSVCFPNNVLVTVLDNARTSLKSFHWNRRINTLKTFDSWWLSEEFSAGQQPRIQTNKWLNFTLFFIQVWRKTPTHSVFGQRATARLFTTLWVEDFQTEMEYVEFFYLK